MSKAVFIYVAHIASSLDKVFKAPTSHETTGKFWFGNAVTSDWKVVSPLEFHREDKLILRGTVLENDPPRGGRPTRFSRCMSRTTAAKSPRASCSSLTSRRIRSS